MKDELQGYLDRPKRYDNIDGTGEMLMGLMLLAFALSSYLNTILPNNRWWNGIGGVLVLYGVLIPALASGYWIRRVIKKHITWPRTGYVAFPRGGKAWRVRMATVSLGAAIFAVACVCLLEFANQHGGMSLFRTGYWALFVVGYAFWIVRMGKEHAWKWFVLLFMALGLLAIVLIIPGDFFQQWRVVALFVGLVWLGSGAATLYSYFRHTKPATPEAE